jgi:hypothetical protein
VWVWWLPLAAAGLHITEEFVWPGGFGDWDRSYRPAIRNSITPTLHVVVNLLLLCLCLSVGQAGSSPEGAEIGGLRFRSLIPPALSVPSWAALAGLLSANAVFHAVGTARARRYSPGLVTGMLLYVPLTAFGLWHFIHGGQLSPLAALGSVAVGASYQLWASIGHRMRERANNGNGRSARI